MRGGAVVLAVASAALVLGGCGGSGTLSMNELRSDASTICAKAVSGVNAIATPGEPGGTAAFLQRGVAVLRPELASLRALKPPSSATGPYTSALDAFDAKVKTVEGTIRGLYRGDDPVSAIQSLQRHLRRTEAREDAAWRTLAIPTCVNR